MQKRTLKPRICENMDPMQAINSVETPEFFTYLSSIVFHATVSAGVAVEKKKKKINEVKQTKQTTLVRVGPDWYRVTKLVSCSVYTTSIYNP